MIFRIVIFFSKSQTKAYKNLFPWAMDRYLFFGINFKMCRMTSSGISLSLTLCSVCIFIKLGKILAQSDTIFIRLVRATIEIQVMHVLKPFISRFEKFNYIKIISSALDNFQTNSFYFFNFYLLND